MATAADNYPRHVYLEELFPIRTFRFIVCNNLAPGYETKVANRQYPVLFYMINGAIEIDTEDRQFVLQSGDFCFLDMGSSQVYRNISAENTYMNVIGFSFSDPNIKTAELDIPLRGSFSGSPIAAGLFQRLHHCWMEQKTGYRLKVLSLFFQILYHISVSEKSVPEIPSEYHRLQDVVRYIYDNCFTKDIDVKDLCSQCNYSPTHLRKLFVKYFQMPPTKYIRHIKLEFAKNMLVLSHKSISQIATESGYKDIAHFDRVFKKETGITPLEYRSMNFINNITEN